MSDDLLHWRRLGLARPSTPIDGTAFDGVDDKDASLFPVAIPEPSGQPETGDHSPAPLPGHSPAGDRPATLKPREADPDR